MIANSLRCSERLPRELKAELILDGKIDDATIENLSKTGIKVRTVAANIALDVMFGTILDLQFELPSGETVRLNCKVRWSCKISPKSLIKDIGLEFTEQSQMYEEWFKTISMDDMLFFYGNYK